MDRNAAAMSKFRRHQDFLNVITDEAFEKAEKAGALENNDNSFNPLTVVYDNVKEVVMRDPDKFRGYKFHIEVREPEVGLEHGYAGVMSFANGEKLYGVKLWARLVVTDKNGNEVAQLSGHFMTQHNNIDDDVTDPSVIEYITHNTGMWSIFLQTVQAVEQYDRVQGLLGKVGQES